MDKSILKITSSPSESQLQQSFQLSLHLSSC